MPTHAPLSRELFAFLRALKKNNDKSWFNDNKARYEEVVREPLLAFIANFGDRLAKISPHFVADPRKQGGSMFRIHRDTRFSKDKSPYKTHVGIQFRHEAGKDAHAPGFYLHLEPKSVFVGGGIWHPDGPTLKSIREAIVEKPRGWKKAVGGRAFKASCELHGASLKRAPKGFDPEHPLMDHIKRKDFIALCRLDKATALEPSFAATCARHFKTMGPLVKFLCEAVGVPY